MCRLCAITDTRYQHRRDLLHLMLLLNNADSTPQRDGWGISDGKQIWKAAGSYRNYDPAPWSQEIDATAMWMGHLRNASTGTGLDDAAAHPFCMEHFIGMHNGAMVGSWGPLNGVPTGSPNSDSWRAFHYLDKLLDEEGATIDSVVEPWLSNYESSSAFVMFLYQQDKLHILRGPSTRTLFYAPFGEGFIFNTDDLVLKSVSAWYGATRAIEVGKVEPFPEMSYAVLSPNSNAFDSIRELKYEPKKSTTTYTSNYNSNYNSDYRSQTVATRQTKGHWMRTNCTWFLNPTDQVKLLRWVQIREKLMPLRQDMCHIFLGYVFQENITSYEDYTDEQLTEIEIYLDRVFRGFDEQQLHMLRTWNTNVPEEDESTVYYFLFSDGTPFWELSNGLDIVKELNSDLVSPLRNSSTALVLAS